MFDVNLHNYSVEQCEQIPEQVPSRNNMLLVSQVLKELMHIVKHLNRFSS